MTGQPSEVLVILDPVFGERLREFWPGRAVWIVMSPTNEPVMKALSAPHAGSSHLIPMARISDSSACLGIPRGSGFMVCFALYVGRSARDGDIDHTYGSYGL